MAVFGTYKIGDASCTGLVEELCEHMVATPLASYADCVAPKCRVVAPARLSLKAHAKDD